MLSIDVADIRPISFDDFVYALMEIKSSVPPESLEKFDIWNSKYGDNS